MKICLHPPQQQSRMSPPKTQATITPGCKQCMINHTQLTNPTFEAVSDSVSRIDGKGPKLISEQMMQMMFKYESGGKVFNHIPTKHLSATIDGFTIKDEYWQKPKIPHSGVPPLSHRQN
ncbi:hypothetical protein PRIPAC_75837 [Pristionchus pacificus]|uniref:CKK domain-containing protein n=1 Tax=Pristionchus pacificus TaxID=54126 RepID=A0A2A6CEP1_PRIPA|nr:hypothetical protein PRIPAC_75837 [Pristionchus pacificus]|eukprot:PDM76705.1 hypothetical protein PRIPAC_42100 [Pristionchus pacificus]